MQYLKLVALSSLALFGITAAAAEVATPQRVLACNMNALTPTQRTRHREMTEHLLKVAKRKDLEDGYLFTVDPKMVSVSDLAEWVANEARCCPAVDFQLELPANGPLTLRLDGGADVKAFLAAELGL